MSDAPPIVKAPKRHGRPLTSDDQLALWVKGEPVHDTTGDGQCCPDFSCCNGPLASLAERKAFLRADGPARMSMLGTFLSRMIEQEFGKDKADKIYISDGNAGPVQ